jgi:hypothetical protein
MLTRIRLLPVLLALLALAACGDGGGGGGDSSSKQPGLTVGAVEDAAKWAPNPGAEMRAAHDAGLRSIVLSAVWERGAPAAAAVPPLRRAVDAAAANGVDPVLAVYQLSSSTPLTPADRTAFAQFAATLVRRLPDVRTVIVGNEPNLNLFWLPQFDAAGGDAAATAYEAALAETYDAVKAVDEDLRVVGGGLAPRGADDPSASRQTHSPTRFIRDLGLAYRAAGRDRPLMDAFAIHPYGESPRVPPTLRHPNTTSLGIADYPKLVRLLGQAFDGTAQRGSKLPVLYSEYGVETTIPAGKSRAYTGHEVIHPVDPETQSRYYVQAIGLARRQPTVDGIYLFHVVDESRLEGLQSGVRYADGSRKPSLAAVRGASLRP